jgi:hypothetical protein
MKLSSVREGLPFELVSRHVKSHQDEEREYDDLTRPEQLNVQADHRATEHSMNFVQTIPSQSSIQYLPAEATLRQHRVSHSHEIRTLRTEFTEYELRAYLQRRNDWSDKVYDSISWPAYRKANAGLTNNLRTFVVTSQRWLPIGVRERLCSGTTDTCPQCKGNRDCSSSYRCESRAQWRYRFVIHLHGHLKETKTVHDPRCI